MCGSALALVSALVPVRVLHAQARGGASPRGATKGAPAACPAPDTASSWYRRQKEWLDERGAKWSDESLRAALLSTAADGAASSGALLGFEMADATISAPSAADSVLIAGLKKLAAERGSTWPTRSVVGARGVLAVWGLAARDTMLARVSLKRMMEAGPEESPPAAVAILEDRQRVRMGRKQLYGTQLTLSPTGTPEPLPIEDLAHLSLRRDGAELPPLAQSLCAAAKAARPTSQR